MASLHSTGLCLTHKCIKCRSFEGLKLIVPFAGQGIVFSSEPKKKKKSSWHMRTWPWNMLFLSRSRVGWLQQLIASRHWLLVMRYCFQVASNLSCGPWYCCPDSCQNWETVRSSCIMWRTIMDLVKTGHQARTRPDVSIPAVKPGWIPMLRRLRVSWLREDPVKRSTWI